MLNNIVIDKTENGLVLGNGLFSLSLENAWLKSRSIEDNQGLSELFCRVIAEVDGVEREYDIWDDLSAIEMPMYEGEFKYAASGNNYTLRTVRLAAVTDYHDNFVDESVRYMFRGSLPKTQGNVFFVDDPITKETIVFISTAPDCAKATLMLENGVITFDGCGYGFVVGECKTEDSERLLRAWYRRKCKPTELYTMANTWGDYNAYHRVADDFIKGEITAASELGLDTLQIDDGWQSGNTDDKAIRDERNRRVFKDGFWDLKPEKFRNGMEEMRDHAEKKGVHLGLWFAPDSQYCYTRMERDISVLENAYKNWGMKYFKFDMLYVDDMDMYKKFETLLNRVYSFGDDVFVQLDVTNGIRCGYLGVTQYGRIFAENRYTKLRTYYPHRTLQNLWNISKYIPTYKFQFELVNPTLNAEIYGNNDLLAPHNFEMDYLFATTMMSNPLFWMEVQFLPEKQRLELNRVMPVWKAIREELANCDVVPVGERPDGAAFTGFTAYSPDGKKAYFLCFREVNDENTYTFKTEKYIKSAKLLASNCNIVYNTEGDKVKVTFANKRSYALIELQL